MNERWNIAKSSNHRRRWGFWAFVAVNAVGAIVAVPLIIAVFPLISIWWDTRSQESFQRYQQLSARLAAATTERAERARQHSPPPVSRATNDTATALNSLTNNLKLIGNLNETELDKIVAGQFGKPKTTRADPASFNRDSAVFHKIERSVMTVRGKEFYFYEVDLVDENGNHDVHVECFEKPDLEYERSMAALQLVNSNPQLKKIYNAFAHVLAEQSSSPEKSSGKSTSANPPLPPREALDPNPR